MKTLYQLHKAWSDAAREASAAARRNMGQSMAQNIADSLSEQHAKVIEIGRKKIASPAAEVIERNAMKMPKEAFHGILHMKGLGYSNNDVMNHLDVHQQTKGWAEQLKNRSGVKNYLDRNFK